MAGAKKYANVILPLKFKDRLTYLIPSEMTGIQRGTWVGVILAGRHYLGVTASVTDEAPDIEASRIRPVESLPNLPAISDDDLNFWKILADYYMCSEGEILKAAYPLGVRNQADVKSRRSKSEPAPDAFSQLPSLSPAQEKARLETDEALKRRKTVLLHGVTGSGKTEIYMHLAIPEIQAGRNVLMMVPEIAMSRQLQDRLSRIFGDSLLVFHSKLTAPQKKAALIKLASGKPLMVLGTRSAIFLPLRNLGMVIVDEEHDPSYKQDDPAPRYNGRDAAILLAAQRSAGVVLGSATPSFEAMYNVAAGKYIQVDLTEKFHKAVEPSIKIIDMRKARRLHDVKGSFSRELIIEIDRTLKRGEQVMVFRSRRAYAPIVQCPECGDIPKCPHCNVSLSYHKFNNSLECHYCGYRKPFQSVCSACGKGEPALKGSGTERIEEELRELFPEAGVERFDAHTTESKSAEKRILEDFAAGKTDILVGTQMITKGFDFDKLSLVAVVSADSLFALQDFRADERALQLLTQLRGRAGRRENPGRMFIQTDQPEHPVLLRLTGSKDAEALRLGSLAERRMFGYPPYVRLIVITLKDRSEGRLWHLERDMQNILKECGIEEVMGPVKPAVDRIAGEMISQFWIRLPRTRTLAATKAVLYGKIGLLCLKYKSSPNISINVDPQ